MRAPASVNKTEIPPAQSAREPSGYQWTAAGRLAALPLASPSRARSARYASHQTGAAKAKANINPDCGSKTKPTAIAPAVLAINPERWFQPSETIATGNGVR